MREIDTVIAGIETTVVIPDRPPNFVAVLLHGYAMDRGDLAPFAHSLGLGGRFYFPRGLHRVNPTGYAWWPIDVANRAAQLQRGPRDLANQCLPGRSEARMQLGSFLQNVQAECGPLPLILGGFSQGGMLACELLLHGAHKPAGLVLFSTSRIAFEEWQPRAEQLRGVPILLSHGTTDSDLAFSAGENLRDWLSGAGAHVTWVPFEGGHQIPLSVWRQTRRFIQGLVETHSSQAQFASPMQHHR